MESAPEIAPLPPVGIVGAGTMGAGIAQVALAAGHPVRLYDPDPAALDRARARIADGLSRWAAKRDAAAGTDAGNAAGAVAGLLDRLEVAPTAEDLAAGATLVIEAVLEDLALKVSLFQALDAAAGPEAILATNTSALSVTAIAAGTRRPGRVIGLHFFNPAPLMRLVEVVEPPSADPPVVDRAMGLMTAWGKTPVRCADAPGFIVNRVNRPYTLEALRILESRLAGVAQLDTAARASGYPMGPFELMDLIGIDVNLAATQGLFEGFGGEPRFRPSPIQERLVAAGTIGRKTGRGFYRYDDAGQILGVSPDVAPGLARGERSPNGSEDPRLPAELEPPPEPLPEPLAEQLLERLTLGIVNEAYRALGEGVASSSDIDIALKLGAGHPLGPFERVEALGGPAVAAERLALLEAAHGRRFAPAPALQALASGKRSRAGAVNDAAGPRLG
jgi:3-hydroxybutyryl-CoA dehydrogenase